MLTFCPNNEVLDSQDFWKGTMFYNSLFLAGIGAISMIITLPLRNCGYREIWQWWDRTGVFIFTFDCLLLFLISIWCGWFPVF